jgi:soluble lytic murein transglycosylase
MFKKRRKIKLPLAVSTGVCVLLIAAALPAFKWTSFSLFRDPLVLVDSQKSNSEVYQLAQLPPSKRESQLEALAQGEKSRSRSQARYLLASYLISQNQGDKALSLLEGLEKEYPLLSGHIALKRALAYELTGNAEKASAAWQEILKRYPKEPVAAEALYTLGKKDPQYWDRALEEFPAHPRTVEIASLRLQKNPNQMPLLLLLAKYGLYHPDIVSALDRLTSKFGAQLSPEDWESVAFAYWEKQEYAKAGAAYAKTPRSPRNFYRAGRGLQLGDKIEAAQEAYLKLIREFPKSEETALALLRLEKMLDVKLAVPYLERVIAEFPEKAPEALLEKSKVLDTLQKSQAAEQARQTLLTKYSNSDAAAELRWSRAQKQAAASDWRGAWKWAQELAVQNPDSDQAPEAAFWVGKWAKNLGRGEDAKKTFEYLLAKYPESYYAWRAAVFLGWDVGDFTTVRQRLPEVVRPPVRPTLPVGSEVLKELYLLGQDRDAWTLWQGEYKNRIKPSVAEQFTDGLMRLAVGDNLEGLFMVSHLRQREVPEERAQYLTLRQQPAYWQALYPFPFLESIITWSEKHDLNPMLVTGLIRQESRFMPGIKSSVGAVGLMQVMPETGAEMAKSMDLTQYKLDNPDNNVQLGTAYLDFTHRAYNNNSLLAVASYNAGPGSVSDWLSKSNLGDPDLFIEKIPFDETRGYVKSVFGNYWNYLRLYNPEVGQRVAQHAASQKTASSR